MKTYKSFAIKLFLILTPVFFLNAGLLEENRAARIDTYVASNNDIAKKYSIYIIKTGDITPTRAEVQSLSNLSNDKFTTFSKDVCTVGSTYCSESGGITVTVSSTQVILTDILKDTNDEVKVLFENSNETDEDSELASNFSTVTYSLSDGAQAIWSARVEIDADANKIWSDTYADLPATGDETKLYYVPNGKDGIDVYRWDVATNDYIKINTITGSTTDSSSSDSSSTFTCLKNIDTYATLEAIKGEEGWCARFNEDDKMSTYYWDVSTSKWIIKGGGTVASLVLFNEDGTIEILTDRDADVKWFDSVGGSTVDLKNIMGNNVVVQRKAHYWASESEITIPLLHLGVSGDRYVYIADTIADLPAVETDGSVAWLKQNNGGAGFEGTNLIPEAIYYDGEWMNYVPFVEYLATKGNGAFGKYFAGETKSYFEIASAMESDGTHLSWNEDTSVSTKPIIFTQGDRNSLPEALNSDNRYLTLIFGDDPAYTVSGINSEFVVQAGGFLKEWFYSTSGLTTHNLLDGAIITIDSTTTNYNLAADVHTRFGSYIPYIRLINNATIGGSGIGGTDTTGLIPGQTALFIDTFPTGSIIEIINNGNIYGGSGNGGFGNRCNASLVRGHDGGTAIRVDGEFDISVTNNGNIYGGGGGGRGNSNSCYCDVSKNGGNGQGYSYGVNAYRGPAGGSHGCNSGVSGASWGQPGSGGSLGGYYLENVSSTATINWITTGTRLGR